VDHPNLSGFDRFAGSMGNLYDARHDDGGHYGYYRWERVEDGAVSLETRYATTVTVDDALDAIATLPEPWLVYVAFNAPHRPLDAPPPELGTYGDLSSEEDDHVLYDAVVEALDTEIGRLLDTVDPDVLERTTIFFMGDNGTERRAIREPWDPRRGKDTPFEGGSNVPLLVTGPLVEHPGTESDAFVHVVDLFPTIEAIAGLAPDGVERDGLSLLPLLADPGAAWPRDVVHYEKFEPSGPPPYRLDWRISRDARWKWMETGDEPLLFDIGDRPDDGEAVDPAALSAEDRAHVDALFEEHTAFWAGLPPPAAP
jgi:arylsulfatase A-like enzyme